VSAAYIPPHYAWKRNDNICIKILNISFLNNPEPKKEVEEIEGIPTYFGVPSSQLNIWFLRFNKPYC